MWWLMGYHYIRAQSCSVDIQLFPKKHTPLSVSLRPAAFYAYPDIYYTLALPEGTDITRWIKNIAAYDKRGNKVKYRLLEGNTLLFPNTPSPLDSVYYEITGGEAAMTAAFYTERENVLFAHPYFFVGFFQNNPQLVQYNLHIKAPAAATSFLLERNCHQGSFDEIAQESICFAPFDSTTFRIDDTYFEIQSFCNDPALTAIRLQRIIEPALKAVKKFGGAAVAVPSYRFVVVQLPAEQAAKGGSGALSFADNSLIVVPELHSGQAEKMLLQQVAAHEFLHNFIPRRLRSDALRSDVPVVQHSQHWWLYEGVTEYFSWLALWQQGLLSDAQFEQMLRHKLTTYTEMPEVPLLRYGEQQAAGGDAAARMPYYFKGAIAAFCMDIALRETSGGKRGLQHLLLDFWRERSKNDSVVYFSEQYFLDTLAQQPAMAALQKPLLSEILLKSKSTLPYNDFLEKVGWNFVKNGKATVHTFGNFDVAEGKRYFYCTDVGQNTLNLEEADALLSVNGEAVNAHNYEQILELLRYPQAEQSVELEVLRKGKTQRLRGVAMEIEVKVNKSLLQSDNFSEAQFQLRKSLLRP